MRFHPQIYYKTGSTKISSKHVWKLILKCLWEIYVFFTNMKFNSQQKIRRTKEKLNITKIEFQLRKDMNNET